MKLEAAEDSLENPDILTKYKSASDIAQKVLEKIKKKCIDGAVILDLCREGDKLIEEETAKIFKDKKIIKGIAFPTCIAPNEIAPYFCPLVSDPESCKVLQEGDLVKISLGVQIDGFAGLLGDTIIIGKEDIYGRKADVLMATYLASEAAIRLIKPGNTNWEVTEAIDKITSSFGCKPCEGTLTYQHGKNIINGKKQFVLNPNENQKKQLDTYIFETNEVYGVDISVSTGDGKTRTMETRTSIFKKTDVTYSLKLKASRKVFTEIQKKFGPFPFTIRALEDEKKARMGIIECANHNLFLPYKSMYEKEGEYIARFFTTIALTKNGTLKLAGPATPNIDQIKTEKKLEDMELYDLIKTPLRKKKTSVSAKTTLTEPIST
ncbi:DNA-binding protein, 42 kDa [Pneumocystis carinii B80]|uniref:DNA-binding protein, 42 kDa n=1 Tax=Pneumocystis carinii (strain B80) TaxID=1408658 RepID=A0A0W4ZC36_PNEC8|nr:DNA-binding protein, 42 kDa [Pneumocystis carinii B80]KTW25898.1 DNA-binding protein, 42 kDa [Pneumocystis carinii B80]